MRKVLEQLKKGKISITEAEQKLREEFVDVSDLARLDINREHRTGVPEVVIASEKTNEQIIKITVKLVESVGRVIITRLTQDRAVKLKEELIDKKITEKCNIIYHPEASMFIVRDQRFKIMHTGGKVGIITAGTSDIPVAEEARYLIEELGCNAFCSYDVGVAGVHRLIDPLKKLVRKQVDVVIVLAGREGALPTLIAGLIDIPVIGVPISTGYGIEGKGKTALYAMLQSCSPLVVVNIDAGFVAGAVASRIATRAAIARVKAK